MKNFERVEAVMQTMKKTIDFQVVKNHQSWGINLVPQNNTALVLSPIFTMEVTGLNEIGDYIKETVSDKSLIADDKSVFYSYFKEKADYACLVRPTGEIMESVLGKVDLVGSCEYNINSVINVMNKVGVELWKKCRVVLVQGFTSEGTAPIKFGNDNGRPCFSIKGINKPCVITDGEGFIPVEYIQPDQSYECTLEQTSSEILIRAIRKFGIVKFGVNISESLFDPEIIPRLNNFDIVPDDLTLTTNTAKIEPNKVIPPLHLSFPIFYDILIMMGALGCEDVTLHFPKDSNVKPCVLESKNKDGLNVRVILAPLNQSYGIQRR